MQNRARTRARGDPRRDVRRPGARLCAPHRSSRQVRRDHTRGRLPSAGGGEPRGCRRRSEPPANNRIVRARTTSRCGNHRSSDVLGHDPLLPIDDDLQRRLLGLGCFSGRSFIPCLDHAPLTTEPRAQLTDRNRREIFRALPSPTCGELYSGQARRRSCNDATERAYVISPVSAEPPRSRDIAQLQVD
jgi:hypothetical protein